MTRIFFHPAQNAFSVFRLALASADQALVKLAILDRLLTDRRRLQPCSAAVFVNCVYKSGVGHAAC